MIHRLYPIINIQAAGCANTPSSRGGFLGRETRSTEAARPGPPVRASTPSACPSRRRVHGVCPSPLYERESGARSGNRSRLGHCWQGGTSRFCCQRNCPELRTEIAGLELRGAPPATGWGSRFAGTASAPGALRTRHAGRGPCFVIQISALPLKAASQ